MPFASSTATSDSRSVIDYGDRIVHFAERPNWVWIGFQVGVGFALASALIGGIFAVLMLSAVTHSVQWTFGGHPIN